MKRTFEIEFPDDLGPMWMNRDNLMMCLSEKCPNTHFTVTDLTQEIVKVAWDIKTPTYVFEFERNGVKETVEIPASEVNEQGAEAAFRDKTGAEFIVDFTGPNQKVQQRGRPSD